MKEERRRHSQLSAPHLTQEAFLFVFLEMARSGCLGNGNSVVRHYVKWREARGSRRLQPLRKGGLRPDTSACLWVLNRPSSPIVLYSKPYQTLKGKKCRKTTHGFHGFTPQMGMIRALILMAQRLLFVGYTPAYFSVEYPTYPAFPES